MLEKEFEYFKEHQDELVDKFNGRVVVIKDEKVIGDYSSDGEAYRETIKEYEPGTFLIQKVESGRDIYTIIFHSGSNFANF